MLCPYIPDGSEFVLKFRINDENATIDLPQTDSHVSRAPDSPSAAPSPYPSNVNLAHLQIMLDKMQNPKDNKLRTRLSAPPATQSIPESLDLCGTTESAQSGREEVKGKRVNTPYVQSSKEKEDESLIRPDDLVLERLRQLNELLIDGKDGKKDRKKGNRHRRSEKKQVVFVIANYFVLFLSIVALCAEIHQRAPEMMDFIHIHLDSVQSCSADRDALYECVSKGNFSGLVAAFIFWITRSATTKNILLFGFETPQRLWTVVYEALVTAVCWGTSYIFIRRAMNPDTRTNFLQKYWKDAVYGSLAGFNAAFMKNVLKNLIPQDQVLDVLETRQLRIVDWVSHLFRHD